MSVNGLKGMVSASFKPMNSRALPIEGHEVEYLEHRIRMASTWQKNRNQNLSDPAFIMFIESCYTEISMLNKRLTTGPKVMRKSNVYYRKLLENKEKGRFTSWFKSFGRR